MFSARLLLRAKAFLWQKTPQKTKEQPLRVWPADSCQFKVPVFPLHLWRFSSWRVSGYSNYTLLCRPAKTKRPLLFGDDSRKSHQWPILAYCPFHTLSRDRTYAHFENDRGRVKSSPWCGSSWTQARFPPFSNKYEGLIVSALII